MTIIDALIEALMQIEMVGYKLSASFSWDTKIATVAQTQKIFRLIRTNETQKAFLPVTGKQINVAGNWDSNWGHV